MEGSKDGRIGLTSVFFLKTFSLGNIGEADIFTRQEKWDSRLIVVWWWNKAGTQRKALLAAASPPQPLTARNTDSLWPLGLFHTLLRNGWFSSLSFGSAHTQTGDNTTALEVPHGGRNHHQTRTSPSGPLPVHTLSHANSLRYKCLIFL